MMMDEQAFRKTLIKVRAQAKQNNANISKEDLLEMFGNENLSKEGLAYIVKFLEDEKITVHESKEDVQRAVDTQQKKEQALMNRQDQSYLSMYLEEIEELGQISEEERDAILLKIIEEKSGEERIPELFLREVVDIARLYENQGVLLEDLIGEGNISLVLGAKMMDCVESAKEAEQLLMKLVMDAMEKLIMEHSGDESFGLSILEKINLVNDKAKEMAEELERKVTPLELCAELQMEPEEIIEICKLSGNAIEYISMEK